MTEIDSPEKPSASHHQRDPGLLDVVVELHVVDVAVGVQVGPAHPQREAVRGLRHASGRQRPQRFLGGQQSAEMTTLTGAEPAQPGVRKVEGHRGGPGPPHVLIMVDDLVADDEPARSDRLHPQVDHDRRAVEDDRAPVLHLVAHDQHARRKQVMHQLRAAEQEVDASLLQVVDVGGVVHVPLGVQVTPAHRAYVPEAAHGRVLPGQRRAPKRSRSSEPSEASTARSASGATQSVSGVHAVQDVLVLLLDHLAADLHGWA